MILKLLPVFAIIAARWMEAHERRILRDGVPLTARELADAELMGVSHPQKIRLMKVDRIPVLNGFLIEFLSRFAPQISPNTIGLSLRYGIYIRSTHWGNRQLIAHECVHTGQYERHGSSAAFLHAYFSQCVISGYPGAELEQEAIVRSSKAQLM